MLILDTFNRIAIPDYLPHTFFIEGGSLAVENALKIAFDWKVRKNLESEKSKKGSQIIHFKQAFHGRSGYTMSLTNTTDPRKTMYFPKFDWPRIENPYLSYPITEQVTENVIKREQIAINQIKDALINNKDDIAGLIIEPIQGEGGDNFFRCQFLQMLRDLANENEFLSYMMRFKPVLESLEKCGHIKTLHQIYVSVIAQLIKKPILMLCHLGKRLKSVEY